MDGDGVHPHNSSSTEEDESSSPRNSTKMDSFQSLVFKGPVAEAITSTKMSMKILFVYIGGSDDDSSHLEQSAWQDSEAIRFLSEHCVVLHLLQGTVDAVHFSAIYPYVSVPALSAIGHNGMLLWHHEGYISAKDLIASVKKARTELHSQEVAAANMIAAAIAANRQDPMSNMPTSNVALPLHEGITDRLDPSSMGQIPLHQLPRSSPACESFSVTEEAAQTSAVFRAAEQEDMASASAVPMSATPSRPSNTISSECGSIPGSTHSSSSAVKIPEISSFTNPTVTETTSELVGPEKCANMSVANSGNSSSRTRDKVYSDYPKKNEVETLEADCKSWGKETSVTSSDLEASTTEIVPEVEANNQGCSSIMDNRSALKSPTKDLSSIHLQIRLLDGASLQARFAATDTLRSVKDFISENRTDGNRAFSLGIPYPRKVFNDQDMEKVLLELNLGTRATIILVPLKSTNDTSDWHPASRANSTGVPSSPQNSELGPGFLGRILSYLNPFSYFGGSSSNQESTSQNSAWQYGPNPSVQNAFEDGGRVVVPSSSKSNISGKGQKIGSSSKLQKRSWGSNIHTLRQDEDEPFRDQNAFWNGNSTQFGGGDNKRD